VRRSRSRRLAAVNADEYQTPTLVVDASGCPACGLRGAFVNGRNFEVCPRCEWVDEPEAFAKPALPFDLNVYDLGDGPLLETANRPDRYAFDDATYRRVFSNAKRVLG
jgi:hypothetical protein